MNDQPLAPTAAPVAPAAPHTIWLKRHWKLASLIAAGVLVVGGGGALAWNLMHPKPQTPSLAAATPTPSPSPSPTPTPLKKSSPLTGVMLDPALAERPVVSVIVENHPDARPQSGLQDAGVVYEALAEGGITRFQTFFLEGQPKALGPVRSLRPYFVDWGFEYNAPVAHAGGSDDGLALAKSTNMKDLNALVIGAPTFYRISSRVAPHNLYTSSSLLDGLLAARGYNVAPTFTPTPRQADHPNPNPSHPNIRISYSSASYDAAYAYDAAHNDYARSVGGKAHIDANTGAQIHVKNVVVEYTPVVATGDDKNHVVITTIGKGQAILFRDGDAVPCTWVKDSRTARTKLVDSANKEIPLNAGNTWYSIVPSGRTVSY